VGFGVMGMEGLCIFFVFGVDRGSMCTCRTWNGKWLLG
jgi:hypothetical protein